MIYTLLNRPNIELIQIARQKNLLHSPGLCLLSTPFTFTIGQSQGTLPAMRPVELYKSNIKDLGRPYWSSY